MGATLLQRIWVAIEADEGDIGERVEDPTRVSRTAEGGVDDDPSAFQCRTKELDDLGCEDRFVIHMTTAREPASRG